MTEVSLLDTRLPPSAGHALAWAGPLILTLLAVLGAYDRWIAPLPLSIAESGLISLLFPIVLLALLSVAIELGRSEASQSRWRRSLAASGAGLLGAVLLVGAWAKALDPVAFAGTIEDEGLVFVFSAPVIAVLAVAIEFGLGSALVVGLRRPSVLFSSLLLVAFFLFLTARAYWRFAHGIVVEDTSCGCFGNLVDRTPAQAFWQDTVLLVPGLLLAFLALERGAGSRWRPVCAISLTIAGIVFAWASPNLAVDDFATRLRPGIEVSTICSGQAQQRLCLPTLVADLEHGRWLLVIADLDDEAFAAAVEDLNAYYLQSSGPTLRVLSAATPQAHQTFFWQHGPSFDIVETPEVLLRPLYRTLPRSFLVEDGRVSETFNGLPPLAELAASQP